MAANCLKTGQVIVRLLKMCVSDELRDVCISTVDGGVN